MVRLVNKWVTSGRSACGRGTSDEWIPGRHSSKGRGLFYSPSLRLIAAVSACLLRK